MKNTRILVVDNDPTIVRFVSANLKLSGYEIDIASNGSDALNKIEENIPDLILLDIMMPGIDGVEVCRRVREWSNIPIIMLSAKGEVISKVQCLELGADDYITKPFGIEEMLARVKAVLRRCKVDSGQPVFTCDNIRVSFTDRRITVDESEVKLTPTEYSLLKELVLNANKVITHEMLLSAVWGQEYGDDRQYLHVFMGKLRNIMERDPQHPKHLITVQGVGYQFRTGE